MIRKPGEKMVKFEERGPFTKIQFFDASPISAYVDAEHRMGTIRLNIRGKPPSDLKIFVSENYSHVTEENATWSFLNPTVFTMIPRE